MEERSLDELQQWLSDIKAFETTSWSALPQLELYMDQVITLINNGLDPLLGDSDRAVTPSMINNYVKAEVLPRPLKKRYNREHLTLLSLICMLKSELSLQEIRDLFSVLTTHCSTEDLYTDHCDAQIRCLQEAAARIGDPAALSEAERACLATELALEANAKRLIASKLVASIAPAEEKDKDKKKKKEE